MVPVGVIAVYSCKLWQNGPPYDSRNRPCHMLGSGCGHSYAVLLHTLNMRGISFVVPLAVGYEVLLPCQSLAPKLPSMTGSFWPFLCSCIWQLWWQVLVLTPAKGLPQYPHHAGPQ